MPIDLRSWGLALPLLTMSACAVARHTALPPTSTPPTPSALPNTASSPVPIVLPFPDAIAATTPSVVQILTVLTNGTEITVSTGTGFLINNEGAIVTANHVIEALGVWKLKSITVSMPLPNRATANSAFVGNVSTTPAEVLATDPERDIAVLSSRIRPMRMRTYS
jgi:S1-C subfamily serine protease